MAILALMLRLNFCLLKRRILNQARKEYCETHRQPIYTRPGPGYETVSQENSIVQTSSIPREAGPEVPAGDEVEEVAVEVSKSEVAVAGVVV